MNKAHQFHCEIVESWGRQLRQSHTVCDVIEIDNLNLATLPTRFGLPFGSGRSYGDSCLNPGETLLQTRLINKVISFDKNTGVLEAQAGIGLDDILYFSVPQGWFLPVVPGTKFVTLGGAIANDIHGKNHHRSGTFGCWVKQLTLIRSDGVFECSPTSHSNLFSTTIGGLGLTGLVTQAKVQLVRIPSHMIDVTPKRFHSLEEVVEMAATDRSEFNVAWIDARFERGIYYQGDTSKETSVPLKAHERNKGHSINFEIPVNLINSCVGRVFNATYFRKPLRSKTLHYDPYFFPLDHIRHWNRLYGKNGFYQYQFAIPMNNAIDAVRQIFQAIRRSKLQSSLGVLKHFGDISSPGVLSFPLHGLTVALDFSNEGKQTLGLFDTLDAIVLQSGGRIYPAKDARIQSTLFQAMYPQWQKLEEMRDPKMNSRFWTRVTEGHL